jgi:hypothetical protein
MVAWSAVMLVDRTELKKAVVRGDQKADRKVDRLVAMLDDTLENKTADSLGRLMVAQMDFGLDVLMVALTAVKMAASTVCNLADPLETQKAVLLAGLMV